MREFTGQDQILDEGFRAEAIKEIVYNEENRERKSQMLRRHEIYRDKNKKWVMHSIEREGFKPETIAQMQNRATNISVCRKIVNKLAQTYMGGVERMAGEPTIKEGKKIQPPSQLSLDSWVDELDFNTNMKKVDRYLRLFRNTLAGIIPVKEEYNGLTAYRLAFKVLAPWEYDVIEDPCDPTKMSVLIISSFADRMRLMRYEDYSAGAQGIRTANSLSSINQGFDSVIAEGDGENNTDANKRQFIWWSGKYHFTTDARGKIIQSKSPEPVTGATLSYLNPIGVNPWENFTTDQDGNFWAVGGEDITEASILINKKMTDVNFISFTQGWGQLVIDAENIPKKLAGGPDNAFIFERTVGGQPASVFFASSNPPIEAWLETVRMTLAMILSTNDLSPRNISAKLDVSNVASGVSLMVENSEILADIKDFQELFRDREPCLWEVLKKWHTLYKQNSWLCKTQMEIEPIPEEVSVKLKFHEMKPPMSDKERLEELKLRKDLGIATIIDLLKKDNPDLSEEEATKKAEELLGEKQKMQQIFAASMKKETDNGVKNGDRAGEEGNKPAESDDTAGGERPPFGGAGDQEGGSDQGD